MPPAQIFKGRSEHQIFVKQVPKDTAKSTLPDLFAPYNPQSFRNLYPDSYNTTVVLSFSTHDEASLAYRDTNGMRLDNTVLRVEMWNEQRTTRATGAAEDVGAAHSGVSILKLATLQHPTPVEDFERTDSPFADTGSPRLKPGDGFTWAQVAGPKRPPAAAAAATNRPSTPPLLHPVAGNTPSVPIVESLQPQVIEEPQEKAPSGSPATPPTCTEGTAYGEGETVEGGSEVVADTPKVAQHDESIVTQAQLTSPPVHSAWDSTNTSDRIARAHCRNCGFCQARLRRTGLNQ